jgi:acyl transferase domain-containing protein/NAD(P)-dependent dehydrogenase (short-subunit alcohol dehydrogenase family)
MGCVFPKANSTKQYWQNILSGDSYFRPMPQSYWHMANFCSDDRAAPSKSYTQTGAFIEDFEFPFLDYRLPPNAMKGVDPSQLVTLEATREALLDAGIEPRSDALTEAVTIIGSSGVDAFAHSSLFLRRHNYFDRLRPHLEEQGLTESQIAELEQEFGDILRARGHQWNAAVAATGAIPSSISNRVAQVFGARGFNMTVDGACASSFVSLEVACHALMAGDANLAIAGGTDLGTNPAIYIGFSRVEGLSPSGMANPFDHTASGLVIGEGTGVVILKRLEDALAQGDRIRAVIRGLGGSSDGAGQAIYAPSIEGRAQALRLGLANAETEPDEVQFLEAHATSTVVGDANEYDAISTVYGQERKNAPLRLGSVKHQIGHLKAAAGMAGLIKTILAMEHGSFPHMPRFTKLTPGAEKPSEHLLVPTEVAPWEPLADGRRVAAVTANGFGGINYHCIVEHGDSYDPPPPRPKVDRAMAVVGIQCEVPQASNVDAFWSTVTGGQGAFSDVEAQQLGWQYHLDRGPKDEVITTHAVAQLGEQKFNALRYKIFPTALTQISPSQLLGLSLADQLLDEAGMELAAAKNVGVSVGSMHDDYFPEIFTPMVVDEWRDALSQCPTVQGLDDQGQQKARDAMAVVGQSFVDDGPPVTEHTLPGWMTNVTAGRMANKLNLRGPNFTVDTACSSGVAALIPAIYQLMFGNVDQMITGGLNRQLSDTFTCGVCALGAVAERVARPFDASGAGFLIGEGGVLYLLKRLADAQRDQDKIYAVIESIGGSSEADSKSMVAPSEEAVTRSISRALERASVPPEAIGVVDTHGSANRISDIVEARALAQALRPDGKAAPVQITAIKSHLGHIYGGSGAASLLSTIQTLRTRTVPGIRLLENVRPELEELLGQVEPRKGNQQLAPDVQAGGVNSIGLGGTNYFAVVRTAASPLPPPKGAPPPPAPPTSKGPSRGTIRQGDMTQDIFICLAENRDGLPSALARALQQKPIPSIITEGDTAGTKLAVTFEDPDGLSKKLERAQKLIEKGTPQNTLETQGVFLADLRDQTPPPQLAFCLPGQGVQYIGMGRHLYEGEPVFRNVVDRIHELAQEFFGFDLLACLLGDPKDAQLKAKMATLVGAQTSVFAIEMAMFEVLRSMGVVPDVLIGQSFGEIAALTAAGVWDLEAAFNVVRARITAAETINQLGGPRLGMMSLVSSEEQRDAILSLVGRKVVLTNINAPNRFILSGELESIEKTVAVADSFGAEARILPIGGAFHSYFMEPAREGYRDALLTLPCNRPQLPVLSTITGEYIEPEQVTSEFLADHLSEQLVTKVNLVRDFRRLHDDGVRHFVEVGPGWSLTKMIRASLDEVPHRVAPVLHPKVGDAETFRRARAFLTALGHLQSAAERRNLPGMFSPDFIDYIENNEPAVLALLQEVHGRFLGAVQGTAPVQALPKPQPTRPPLSVPARRQQPPLAAAPAPVAAAPAVAPAPEPAPAVAAAEPTEADQALWVKRVTEKLVEVTGYPEEMLEHELDLEADLGVDSVQRAEIWVSLTSTHGLDQDARPQGVKTISQLAGALAALSQPRAPQPAVAQAAATAPAAQAVTTAQPSPTEPAGTVGEEELKVWLGRAQEKLVELTGYPAEMLEPDLDLEADLGVDSVQRADMWVSLTETYRLDTDRRPQGVRTLRELAQALAALSPDHRSASASAPQPVPAAATSPAPVTGVAQAHEAPPSAPTPTSSTSASASPTAPALWVDRVRTRLAELTGYPDEMLESQLDLEADLGVDSVQRAELWVSLTTQYELDKDARPKGVRTIEELAGALAALAEPPPEPPPGPTATAPRPTQETVPSAQGATTADVNADSPPARAESQLFRAQYRRLPEDRLEPCTCQQVLLIAASPSKQADRLAQQLRKAGKQVSRITTTQLAKKKTAQVEALLEGVDTLFYTAHEPLLALPREGKACREALDNAWRQLYSTFTRLSGPLTAHAQRVVVPVTMDGTFGAGELAQTPLLGAFPAGFVRSLRRELPQCSFQLIDTGSTTWSDALLRLANQQAPQLEVGLHDGGFVCPSLAKVADSPAYILPLTRHDRVLVTGGARGIVFECVQALAQRTGCQLILTGRTPLPEDEPSWLGANPQDIDQVLRTVEIELVQQHQVPLREAKAQSARARSQWELHRNLNRLRQAGIEAHYEECDVTSPEALAELLKKLSHAGPIQGVVHGAGIQRAKLLTELAEETVEQTLATKLSPLFTLWDELDWSQVKLFSLFGSVTGLFGNAGQTDYGLANDLAATMVQQLGQQYPKLHAQSLDWTAWVGTGMVSAEEAKRFEQAGLVPVTVEEGVKLFLEGVFGNVHQRLAVFNEGAAFASNRTVEFHEVAARPRNRLVDNGKSPDANHLIRLSLSRDTYLRQHLVKDAPVAPGTFITEMFAEIAHDEGLSVADVRFRRPLQLRGPELAVEIARQNSSLIALPAGHPPLEGKALKSLSYSTCRLEKPIESNAAKLELTSNLRQALSRATAASKDSFYGMLDANYSNILKTGPVFRGIRATLAADELYLGDIRLSDEAAALLAIPGQFIFNPVLADMAVQVVVAQALQQHQAMTLPYRIGRVHVGGPTPGRQAVVICRANESTAEQSTVDVAVRDPEGQLIFAMDEVVVKAVPSADM